MAMLVIVLVLMLMPFLILQFVLVRLLRPVLLARQLFLAMAVHIHFGSRNPAAVHARDLQPRPDVERRDRLLQKPPRHSRIHQRPQEHIAADSGKTIQVSDSHKLIRTTKYKLRTTEDAEFHRGIVNPPARADFVYLGVLGGKCFSPVLLCVLCG